MSDPDQPEFDEKNFDQPIDQISVREIAVDSLGNPLSEYAVILDGEANVLILEPEIIAKVVDGLFIEINPDNTDEILKRVQFNLSEEREIELGHQIRMFPESDFDREREVRMFCNLTSDELGNPVCKISESLDLITGFNYELRPGELTYTNSGKIIKLNSTDEQGKYKLSMYSIKLETTDLEPVKIKDPEDTKEDIFNLLKSEFSWLTLQDLELEGSFYNPYLGKLKNEFESLDLGQVDYLRVASLLGENLATYYLTNAMFTEEYKLSNHMPEIAKFYSVARQYCRIVEFSFQALKSKSELEGKDNAFVELPNTPTDRVLMVERLQIELQNAVIEYLKPVLDEEKRLLGKSKILANNLIYRIADSDTIDFDGLVGSISFQSKLTEMMLVGDTIQYFSGSNKPPEHFGRS